MRDLLTRSVPPNVALCSIPCSSFSKDSVPVEVRPEDVVSLVIDDSPWNIYWWHSGGGKMGSRREERIVGFLGR